MEKPRRYESRSCVVCEKEYFVSTGGHNPNKQKNFRKRNAKTCSSKCAKEYYINRNKMKGKEEELMMTKSKVVLAIDKSDCARDMRKRLNISISYLYILLRELTSMKVIEYVGGGGGRIRYFKLTEKGKQIKKELLIINKNTNV